jgi:hypothetical protein
MWWWVHTNAAVDKLLRLGERHLYLSALNTYVKYSRSSSHFAYPTTSGALTPRGPTDEKSSIVASRGWGRILY